MINSFNLWHFFGIFHQHLQSCLGCCWCLRLVHGKCLYMSQNWTDIRSSSPNSPCYVLAVLRKFLQSGFRRKWDRINLTHTVRILTVLFYGEILSLHLRVCLWVMDNPLIPSSLSLLLLSPLSTYSICVCTYFFVCQKEIEVVLFFIQKVSQRVYIYIVYCIISAFQKRDCMNQSDRFPKETQNRTWYLLTIVWATEYRHNTYCLVFNLFIMTL